MSAGIPSLAARRKGSSSRRRSVCLPARTTGSSLWESADVSPCPGKCFPTGRIPREREPFAKAIPRAAAMRGSSEKARSPIAGLRGLLPTSRTGAKFTSIPTARSSAAVAAPTASATDSFRQQKREQARAGGNRVNGGSFNRATRPPSWSTAISGRGLPRPAADRISRHNPSTWAGLSMFRAKRTTPPTRPPASHRDKWGGSDIPSKPTQRGEAMPFPCFMARETVSRGRGCGHVEGVAESVPQEVERHDGEKDRGSGGGHEVRRDEQEVASLADHRPPRRRRRRDAQPQEREPRLRDDGARDPEGRLHEDRGDRVGQDVAQEQARRRAARGAGRCDELPRLPGEHLGADH